MNATTHETKWAITHDNAGAIPAHFRPYIIVDRESGCKLCEFVWPNTPWIESVVSNVAAAPELLAALKRLVDQAELTDDFGESEHSTLRSAVAQARRAIELATRKVTVG